MKFPLTANLVRLISKSDRQKLGLKTQDELCAAAAVKSERDLHKQVGNVLRLRGIEFFESRMDRKTGRPKGEPDFLFCIVDKVHESAGAEAGGKRAEVASSCIEECGS